MQCIRARIKKTGLVLMVSVLWLTGLAGAGKTSIAQEVTAQLRAAGRSAVLLDGDEVRAAISDESVGYDRESRLKNAFRICRLAALLEAQDMLVVVATMSLFSEVHQWNRENFGHYFEVFVEVTLDDLKRRDQKGLYTGAVGSSRSNVVGMNMQGDMPKHPDLTVFNGSPERPVSELARLILIESGLSRN